MRQSNIYTPQKINLNTKLELDQHAAQHLGKVLRAQKGDPVRLFNGDGHFYEALITDVSKKQVNVQIVAAIKSENESPLHTHIGIVMSRGDRMDYAIQKSVELGVSRITPLTSARCEVKLSAERQIKRIQHWRQVAISACEQSGRASVPNIESIVSVETFINQKIEGTLGLVFHHRDTQALTDIQPIPKQVDLLIGPEGGLSESEIKTALGKGFKACTLGGRVFRTETAPVAALSVLQWLWGDFNAQGNEP